VAIALYDLVPDSQHYFSLFEDTKRQQLTKALDNINAKYGKYTIYFGGMAGVEMSAPTRIAFTSIPQFDV
jgi:DNA polymerase-4